MNRDPQTVDDWRERPALVVFSGRADLWWLRWLRPGFRHCAVFLLLEGQWVLFNPLSHATNVAALPGADIAALAGHLRAQGYTVAVTRVRRPPARPAPWRPYTCVEAVKRLLGLQARWVLTPWQLYRQIGPEAR